MQALACLKRCVCRQAMTCHKRCVCRQVLTCLKKRLHAGADLSQEVCLQAGAD